MEFLKEILFPLIFVAAPFLVVQVFMPAWFEGIIDSKKHKLGEGWWKLAPFWSRYAAMDEDGQWNWFSEKPELVDGMWRHSVCAKCAKVKDIPFLLGEKFENSLTKRPVK